VKEWAMFEGLKGSGNSRELIHNKKVLGQRRSHYKRTELSEERERRILEILN
jgi:hypothetical protein